MKNTIKGDLTVSRNAGLVLGYDDRFRYFFSGGKFLIPINVYEYVILKVISSMHPSRTYHIYNHANGGDDLFREESNYHYFLGKWKKYIDPVGSTIAYCLMPNHFHVMLEVKGGELLVEELVTRKKLGVIKHLRGLSEVESVSDLKDILGDENLSSTIDLEGVSKILTNFIIQQFSNFFNGYTKAIDKRYHDTVVYLLPGFVDWRSHRMIMPDV